MQGFLWLLLQMAVLLLAAAAVFFWLGWHWRGLNARTRMAESDAQIDAECRATESARRDRDAANANLDELKTSHVREAADLQEAQARQRNLEREVLRLSDELKAARSQAAFQEITPQQPTSELTAESPAESIPELAPAPPTGPASPPPTESTPELTSEPVLESPVESALAPVAETQPIEIKEAAKPKAAPPAKEPRPKKAAAPAATKTAPTKVVNGRNILKRLEKSLATQATLSESLRTKCDEAQRQVEAQQAQNDHGALRQATKSLAKNKEQLTEALAALESRQRQVRAVSRSLETSVRSQGEDDLTHIKGIKGPVNDQLRSLGVRTYLQISQWTDEEAIAFGELLAIKKNAARDLWRAQARELHLAQHGDEG